MARNPYTGQVRPTSRPLGRERQPVKLAIGAEDGRVVLVFTARDREHRCPMSGDEALRMAAALVDAAYRVDPSLLPPELEPGPAEDLLAESIARTSTS